MNIGRNEPCHCGSGKKYKKCCLAKDEEARRAARPRVDETATPSPRPLPSYTPPVDTPPPPPPPPDPHIEALNARWDAFEASDYEGRIALFYQTLDEPELMDGQMAFDMLESVYLETIERGERDRFNHMVESLRERRPEAYAENACYMIEWHMSNALVAGQTDLVRRLALELAPLARKEPDSWVRAEAMMAYYGHLPILVEAMRPAHQAVKRKGAAIVPWAIDDLNGRAVEYEFLDYLSRTPDPKADDPELLERITFFEPVGPQHVAAYLNHFTGTAATEWEMSLFDLAPPPEPSRRRTWEDEDEDEDEDDEAEAEVEEQEAAPEKMTGRQYLYYLTVEFLGYLHREGRIPLTRANLGCVELIQYIVDRDRHRLEPQEIWFGEPSGKRGKKGKKSKRGFYRPENKLVPDRDRLDRYIARQLQIFNLKAYEEAALAQIIPSWLRFLESRGLIDAELRARSLRDLQQIPTDLLQLLKTNVPDPAIDEVLRPWNEEIGQMPPAGDPQQQETEGG